MIRVGLLCLLLACLLACGRVDDPGSGGTVQDAGTDSATACPAGAVGVMQGQRCPVEGADCSWSCGEMGGPWTNRSMTARCQAGAWTQVKMQICHE